MHVLNYFIRRHVASIINTSSDSATTPTASTSTGTVSNAVLITCSGSDYSDCTINFGRTCSTRAQVQCCKLVAGATSLGAWVDWKVCLDLKIALIFIFWSRNVNVILPLIMRVCSSHSNNHHVLSSFMIMAASPPQMPSFSQPLFTTTTTSIRATIRWTIATAGGSRPATRYQINCSSDGYNSRIVPSTTTTLYSLQPCALYTCCVGGIDTNGVMGAVDCLTFRTPLTPIPGNGNHLL